MVQLPAHCVCIGAPCQSTACDCRSATCKRQNDFARDLGLHATDRHAAAQHTICLLCHRLHSRAQLQALLWDFRLMNAFLDALRTAGVLIVASDPVHRQVSGWFGTDILTSHTLPCPRLPSAYRLLHLIPAKGATACRNFLLQRLAEAGFVSAANEHVSATDYYVTKVRAWFAAGHSAVIDHSTGIEYFAQRRSELWMMVSIGVQSASNKGCVSLHDFLYEKRPLKPACFHDRLGLGLDSPKLDAVTGFIHEVINLLGGPSMALVHDVYLDSLGDFKYVKIELCRNETTKQYVEETGDLSFIIRPSPGFTVTSTCNENVAGQAMRCVHNDEHDHHIGRLFIEDNVPLSVYLAYDIAKAIRVVPHSHAVFRRRYAGLLAQRDLAGLVPDGEHAEHSKIQRTNVIRVVDAEGHIVQYGYWILCALIITSIFCTGGAAYAISLDPDVNSAELLSTALTLLGFLLLSLPHAFAAFIIADGYSLVDMYRGRAPMTKMLQQHGVGFLRECVFRGVDVEGTVSGRYACFLMGRARGGLAIGPVRIIDLDDRWDFGVNNKGIMCLRYKGIVGDMQIISRKKNGRQLRWWHCAAIGSHVVKGMRKNEIQEVLGKGEIG